MRHIKISILFSICVTILSCSEQAFPDSRLSFTDKFLNLLKPYHVGDTLIFENRPHQAETFIITKKDSTILNNKGWFINARPYKYVSLSYNQLPDRQWSHEKTERDNNNVAVKTTNHDDELIGLNIYPDKSEESCDISFKNFRGGIKNSDTIITRKIIANGLTIANYYKVSNNACDLVKDSNDISTIYITNDQGIIAFQDQKGNWWTRAN